jgi:hypothetical protein
MDAKRYMDSMTTVLSALHLKKQDTEFFIVEKGQLMLNGKSYLQKDVNILRTYRFEGDSDPADQAIIYVIRTKDGNMGYCIDGYGMSSSHTSDLYHEFITNASITNVD